MDRVALIEGGLAADDRIRDVTERPKTVECGSNILGGAEPESVTRCVMTVLNLEGKRLAPREYLVDNVSDTVVKILSGYLHRPDFLTGKSIGAPSRGQVGPQR